MTRIIGDRKIKAFVAASYFEKDTSLKIQKKTGAKAVILTLDTYGREGIDSYFKLVDFWIDSLLEALG